MQMPATNAKAQVASSEVVRDINRRIVLNLIRTRQPISRADLSRVSGMQRSTISLIVEQLMLEQFWPTENSCAECMEWPVSLATFRWDSNGPVCGCGGRGCWEAFASNRAALRYYLESGSDSGGLGFQDLLSRAERGDTRAAKALETMAQYLGRGMRMIVAGLAPECIVVVGDLTRCWHRFGGGIEGEVQIGRASW